MANSFNLSTLTSDEQLFLRAKSSYYDGNPIMEDSEFDILEEQLRQVDSFVVDIVGKVKINGNKVTVSKGKAVFVPHKTPMGSLGKIQFKPGYVPFTEFVQWMPNISGYEILEFGPKLDGNAINMTYDNGKLVTISSRGDGLEGQDYTSALSQNVPNYIKGFTGEIRGEAVIDIYLFNTTYGPDSNATKKYSNARNFVAGTLTKGDKTTCADIDIICFEIVNYISDSKQQLIKWGFETLSFTKTYTVSEIKNLSTFEKMYKDFKTYRENSKYQLDGIVVKCPENLRSQIGGNSHHPFWALAIKFETPAVYTTILSIEWSLGKRGQLSPVAILEAVDLLGSVVTRASIYNADWMIKNKCFPGSVVALIKSGDIIPKIIEIISSPEN
jgi:DNA ligase (NAD+)